MKLKDLPDDLNLRGIKFKYEDETWFWHSQWNKGIWAKKDMNDKRIYPLFLDKLEDALNLEFVGDFFGRITVQKNRIVARKK